MQRVIVMGPPGSGKSTLARRLGAQHGLPVFHLDQAFFLPGWIEVPPEDFRAEVERVAALPAWVIDGNYLDTMGPRLRAADTVIYLDAPTWLCMRRLIRRIFIDYGRVRADAAPGCVERLDLGFLCFARNWNRTQRPSHLALAQGFGGRVIIVPGGGGWRDDFAG